MRCKKHYTDLSSTIGVCSCCLRERLLHLIQLQEQQNQTLEQTLTLKHHNNSVKSLHSDPPRHHHHHHHTYSDQLAPTTTEAPPKKQSSFKRFISFRNIFRSILRKKKTVHVEETVMTAPVTRVFCRDRGMSPARISDDESTTESWKNTPRRNGKRGHVRNGSGLTFCVSPYLVRPSPNRDANLMNTKSFCANRSRKLADFGRPSLNR